MEHDPFAVEKRQAENTDQGAGNRERGERGDRDRERRPQAQ